LLLFRPPPPPLLPPPPPHTHCAILLTLTRTPLFTPPPTLHTLQERRTKERAERLAKLRAGQPSGAPKRPAAQKALGKSFYKQLVVDSEYQGEDYEVFSNWLGTTQ
jgi:large subunit ribosomal protein L4e